MTKWHIQEDFTLHLIGETFSLFRDGEVTRFHVDEVDDMIDALKRAKSYILAEEIKASQEIALARWGQERTPAI